MIVKRTNLLLELSPTELEVFALILENGGVATLEDLSEKAPHIPVGSIKRSLAKLKNLRLIESIPIVRATTIDRLRIILPSNIVNNCPDLLKSIVEKTRKLKEEKIDPRTRIYVVRVTPNELRVMIEELLALVERGLIKNRAEKEQAGKVIVSAISKFSLCKQ
ncbi:hypothetical protein J4526_07460 [Desulfurococcaceae archaeon MEX13E-LK6-19]|nr:hypothetical protein J4526_07460 [Desulfurococcaceae archaeon MEX13E-LK6-19]